MALILKNLYKFYNWIFDEVADPRVEELNLFMMSSPIVPVLVIISYYYFVRILGPELMKHRKPFNLKYVMIIYNLIQIVLNAYIVREALTELSIFKWNCAPVDYSRSLRAIHVLNMYHVFFLLKAADLLDTIFFVLRKKYKQITFLHLYHHIGMFLMMWIVVKFLGGGSGFYVGFINGLVHVFMYSYYLLTALDEKWKNSLVLKRSITQIQIVQFLTFIIIYGKFLLSSNCAYPKLTTYFFVPQNVFMLALFGDFYWKTYIQKKKPSKIPQNGRKAAQ